MNNKKEPKYRTSTVKCTLKLKTPTKAQFCFCIKAHSKNSFLQLLTQLCILKANYAYIEANEQSTARRI